MQADKHTNKDMKINEISYALKMEIFGKQFDIF